MLKNIFGSLDIIKSKKTKNKDRKDITIYTFNDELIKLLDKLIKRNSTTELDDKLLEKVNIIIPQDINFNNYMFGKLH